MKTDINAFSRLNVLVIGDLMIDEYLWGNVDRISPEAPVPVVCVNRENHTLGGAGNVINNLTAMGAGVHAVGTAGTGRAGRMILDQFRSLGLSTEGIVSEPNRPTTRKTRVIAASQQVLRIDREIRQQISGQTLDRLMTAVESHISRMDLVILSDYDKGLITDELVRGVVRLAKKHQVLVLADPKALDFSRYRSVSLLTPNQKEAGLAASMEIRSDSDLTRAALKIMEKADLERLVITCGSQGMWLFEGDLKPVHIESRARQVYDVSGAGDTVISLLGLGLAAGFGFEQSARVANAAAGIVVGKVGTATASISELEKALSEA